MTDRPELEIFEIGAPNGDTTRVVRRSSAEPGSRSWIEWSPDAEEAILRRWREFHRKAAGYLPAW